jgi:precorrin-6B methylase 2
MDRTRSWGPPRGTNQPESLFRLYEIELNGWIRQFVSAQTAVFDIGAQYGFDSLMFARLGAYRVLTVEAEPDLEPLIRRNIERNGLVDRVSIEINWVGNGTEGTVTLDELASRAFMPDFIKIDIEGSEAEALRGAPEVLKNCSRWLIETHSIEAEKECVAILSQFGFVIDTVNPRRWLPDRRPIAHNRWVIARKH